jgi:hypothetical protein
LAVEEIEKRIARGNRRLTAEKVENAHGASYPGLWRSVLAVFCSLS